MPEIIDDPQPQIRQRTHGQRDLVAGEPPHQHLILQGAIAVIDAGDAEHVEGFPDVAGGPSSPAWAERRNPHHARG